MHGDESDQPLDRFRAVLVREPGLMRALGAIEGRESFAEAAIQAASGRGIALDREALIRRGGAAPAARLAAWPGREWLPVAVRGSGEAAELVWSWFGDIALTDAFFEDSLVRARRRPLNRLLALVSPLLPPAGEVMLPPTGLIFHQSRCGSTLVAQMLARLDGSIVVSEAPAIDAAVQLDSPTALRAVVGAFGRPRAGETRYFLKLDSWHSLALPLFRAAFPDVPWIFLTRDPVEILVSHMRLRGRQTVPDLLAPERLGIPPWQPPVEDYCARVLGRIAEAAGDHYGLGGGMVVDHMALPDAMGARILPHFGIAPTSGEHARMAEAASVDAKHPMQEFRSDGAEKRAAATAAIRDASARHMARFHDRLLALSGPH